MPGLPQKAGFPQHALNEIHGGWYDPSNPVVPMSGQLRGDLFQQMLDWEQRTDLCLALGSSLCGMNADRMVVTPAEKAAKGEGLGAVIVSLQRTQHDAISSLRIYAKIDDVMSLLAEEMALAVVPDGTRYAPDVGAGGAAATSAAGVHSLAEGEEVFRTKYGPDGALIGANSSANGSANGDAKGAASSKGTILDLREGATVTLTSGPHAGDEGVVVGRNNEGHWRITFRHRLKKTSKLKVPFQRVLGSWWVEAAIAGTVDRIPIVSADGSGDDYFNNQGGDTVCDDDAKCDDAADTAGAVSTEASAQADRVAADRVAVEVAVHYGGEAESGRPYDYAHVFDTPPPPSLLTEIRRRANEDANEDGEDDDAQ